MSAAKVEMTLLHPWGREGIAILLQGNGLVKQYQEGSDCSGTFEWRARHKLTVRQSLLQGARTAGKSTGKK